MFSYKLTVAYDGTNYNGFQRQKNGVGVQQVLEKALSTLLQDEINVQAAGRTDTGVHAQGQVVSFTSKTKFPADKIPQALDHLLPSDIVVVKGASVSEEFHARYDAVEKTYQYKIKLTERPDPCLQHYAWQLNAVLDVAKMQQASDLLLGTHDFSTFRNSGAANKNPVRTITKAKWQQKGHDITFTITGDGFLYRMVRNLVGTLVRVGEGKLTPEDFAQLLAEKEREAIEKPAPPQGLYLMKVKY